jgi:predicted transporter
LLGDIGDISDNADNLSFDQRIILCILILGLKINLSFIYDELEKQEVLIENLIIVLASSLPISILFKAKYRKLPNDVTIRVAELYFK